MSFDYLHSKWKLKKYQYFCFIFVSNKSLANLQNEPSIFGTICYISHNDQFDISE